MADLFDFLFGPHATAQTITDVQMTTRALLMFFAALALLRLSGPRTFGGSTAFDLVVKIMLGSVLSRAVVGASSFTGTLLASLAFVLLHRVSAWGAFHYEWIDKIVKGRVFVLYDKGQVRSDQLRDLNLNEKDVLEGLHENGNIASFDKAETVYLERDGSISVVKKDK